MSRNWEISDLQPHLRKQAIAKLRQQKGAGVPLAGGSEAAFQSWLAGEASSNGWTHYHTADSRKSEPGFPDTALRRDGVVWIAELKRSKDLWPSEDQAGWLSDYSANVPTFLWYPEDMSEIRALLRGDLTPGEAESLWLKRLLERMRASRG